MIKRVKNESSLKRRSNLDLGLLVIIFGLTFLGVILVYDASVVRASTIFGGKYYFLIFQSLWAILGVIVLFTVSNVDYTRLLKLSRKLLILSIFLLSLTVLTRFLPGSLRNLAEVFIPNINSSHRS